MRRRLVRVYKDEGASGTPFDLCVLPDLDCLHLVSDVIDRVPKLGARAAYAKQAIRDKLIDHKEFIARYGDDMPEITGWRGGESPLAPLMAQAQDEGYPGERVSGKPFPYHGYFFRILTAQGTSAAEGARNYLHSGRMTNGFALVAWPASYGASGIMSFVVNQDGIMFQKDLGPNTATVAAAMKLFDPDLTWAQVEVVN